MEPHKLLHNLLFYLLPAGLGLANPPPLALLILGPNASNAFLMLSLPSSSPSFPPSVAGVEAPEGGRGT